MEISSEKVLKNKTEKIEKFQAAYDRLNSEQRLAVDAIDGPVMVIAGPGTGKTQILTLRIANIIHKLGADIASNILALTFTNSGAAAMRERLAGFIGLELAQEVGIFTFHSFAKNQIEENPEIFHRFLFSRPITEVEKLQIIEKILEKGDYRTLKSFAGYFEFYAPAILQAIDDLKQEAISPEKFIKSLNTLKERIIANLGDKAFLSRRSGNRQKGDLSKTAERIIEQQKKKQKELADIYQKYQKELKRQRLYDFSDMILAVVEEAENNADYLALLQEQYQYLLIDEHQDTNQAQNRLVELIASAPVNEGRPNIFTVGDEKQAIFAFQGASLENFLKFQKKYPATKVITLKNNYRSSQCILDSAQAVLAGEKKLEAKNEKVATLPHKIRLAEFTERKEELIWLAEDIRKALQEGVPANEIAVFYRQNKNLPEIKAIFDKQGIPYQVFSRENILDSPEIAKLLLYLRAIADPFNDEVLGKLLFADFLELDAVDILKIFRYLDWRGPGQIRHKSVLKIIGSPEILKKLGIENSMNLQILAEKLKKYKHRAENKEFVEFLEEFLHDSGLLVRFFQGKNSLIALRRLDKIFNEAKKQVALQKNYRLADFLQYIDILQRYQIPLALETGRMEEGVRLMTAHYSKGLEFDRVYLTNLTEGVWPAKNRGRQFILPISKQMGGKEDERRLFYVALTRGRCQVTISYARLDEEGRERLPSSFLELLPAELTEKIIIPPLSLKKKMKKILTISSPKPLVVFDPDHVRRQFLEQTLSITALNNYLQSPVKYFFRNLLRLPSIQTRSLIYGNVIHHTLEKFFSASRQAKKILSERDLLTFFRETMETTVMPEKYFRDIYRRGEEALKAYYRHYRQEFKWQVETEKKYYTTFPLRNGETLKLYGIIDKLEKSSAGWRVVDYKTGRTFSQKQKEEKEALKRQLVFYKLLFELHHRNKGESGEKVTEGVLDFVEPHKHSGKFEKITVPVSTKEVKQLEEQIQDFAQDILSGEFLTREYKPDQHNKEFFDLWQLREKYLNLD